MQDADAIAIGSGIGGLVAASLLSRYGKSPKGIFAATVASLP